MKSLSAALFDIGAGAMRLQAFQSANPTAYSAATQEQLAEVLEGVPHERLTPQEINHMAAEYDERRTEGRPLGKFRREGEARE